MAMTRSQNLIGTVMGGCVLEQVLGYGGTSTVYLARQEQPEREVAVKVFQDRSGPDGKVPKDFYRRFLLEAEAASKLDHPNVLPVYSYGQQDGLPYIVMPYMPGGTLADYIEKHGALTLQEAIWYMGQIASALDYAHEQECVHCDVKPANILLDSSGQIRLSDFGIARVSHGSEEDGRTFTRNPEALVGTPDYISPEQAMGREVDGRTDIYSLAITLFYLLAKQLPFYADAPIALALLHVHKHPPSLSRIRSDVTEAIDEVLYKALAKKPEERYQTGKAFSDAFAEAVEQAIFSGAASGKRATVMVSIPGQLSGPLTWEPSPVVAKRSWVQRIGFVRLLSMAFLIFTVFLAGSFATLLAVSRANHPPTVNVSTSLATAKGNPTGDRLADLDGWPENSTFFYSNGPYHIHNMSSYNMALALYQDGVFNDFILTVTMSQIQPPAAKNDTDFFGVVLRATQDQKQYYLFEVDPLDGNQYEFLRYDQQTGWRAIAYGTLPALNSGLGKINTLSIQAKGNSFLFRVNNKSLGKAISDPLKQPLSSGRIGLYVENKGSEVAFSHLYVNPLK